MTSIGRSGSDEPSGCQPSASAADASSQSGIPNADKIRARIAELRKMRGHDASDIWIIRSEISWLEDSLGDGR